MKAGTSDEEASALPSHVEGAVAASAQLHEAHERESSRAQKVVQRITARAGSPGAILVLSGLVLFWVALNLALKATGHKPLDEPPFFWMQGVVALTALYTTLLVLATQRRDDQLASKRDQLTLQLSILAEQKTAKVIDLLEELRRDSPTLRNRDNSEVAEMSSPADPRAVLNAIENTLQKAPE